MGNDDEFDPEFYQGKEVRRLLRSDRAMMGQTDAPADSNNRFQSSDPSYARGSYQGESAGLLGRLQALLGAQAQYQPRPPSMDPQRYELADAITNVSQRLGIEPHDLATAISYETRGTFDHNIWGGTGRNYFGLIQMGPAERAKYGVKEGQSITEQMGAVERFLRDRRLKPGMGLLDIYSTINAGSPGHYDLSDANKGGASGTVEDKVNTQMDGHKTKATGLLRQYTANRPPYSVPPAFPDRAAPIFPALPRAQG